MKRILITITFVLTSLIGFGQLNLDGLTRGNYFNTLDDLNNKVKENNSSLGEIKIYEGYEFLVGRKYNIAIFSDKNGEFLDLLFYYRIPNGRYAVHSHRNTFYYDENRSVEEVKITDNYHKFIMNDNSYILITYKDSFKDKNGDWDGEITFLDYINENKKSTNWQKFVN